MGLAGAAMSGFFSQSGYVAPRVRQLLVEDGRTPRTSLGVQRRGRDGNERMSHCLIQFVTDASRCLIGNVSGDAPDA
jgi:hypothetical protein